MKALKEKRIGLRSLLRRGLVILSLFALVFAFASCADSDGDDDTSQPPITNTDPPVSKGTVPARIEIVSWPTNDQYEGYPLDLTGLEVRVFAADKAENNWTIKYPGTKFSTYPTYAVGVIGQEQGGGGSDLVWLPQLQYDLTWISTDYVEPFTVTLDLQDPKSKAYKDAVKAAGGGTPDFSDLPTVIPIARAAKWTDLPDPTLDQTYVFGSVVDLFNWSKGLSLTANPGHQGQKIYVDDYPKLDYYTLKAEYEPKVSRKLGGQKYFPLGPDTDWRIVVDYDYAPTDTKQEYPIGATGGLFVTVGTNPLTAKHPYVLAALKGSSVSDDPATWPYKAPEAYDLSDIHSITTADLSRKVENTIDPGLTVWDMYEEIYIVSKIDVTTKVALKPFFYWEDDSPEAWFDRLVAADGEITVSYKGYKGPAPSTKKFTPKQLQELNTVWYNTPFEEDYPGQLLSKVPFAVKGIVETSPTSATHAKNREPQIKINYRGVYSFIDTPVYTRLVDLTVRPANGDSISVAMRPQDNDGGATNSVWFDTQVVAVARFTAASLPADQVPVELTVTLSPEDGSDLVAEEFRPTGASYSPKGSTGMVGKNGEGNPADEDVSQAEYYSNNYRDVSSNYKNNGKTTAVRFFYASPDLSEKDGVEVGSRRAGYQLPVTWSNIPQM